MLRGIIAQVSVAFCDVIVEFKWVKVNEVHQYKCQDQ